MELFDKLIFITFNKWVTKFAVNSIPTINSKIKNWSLLT